MFFGIRDPGSEIRDPGSGMGKNPDPGSRINIPDPQHWAQSVLKVIMDHMKTLVDSEDASVITAIIVVIFIEALADITDVTVKSISDFIKQIMNHGRQSSRS
jgi:hypothetical protein